jgi:opacity protein-like surface antigen
MKKVLSSLLLATAVTSVVSAAPFNGFYAGAEAGYTRRNVEGKMETPSYKKSKNVSAFNYGVFAGYGVNSNSFYFGGEAHIGHTNANKKQNHDIQGVQVWTKYERGMNYGIAPRFGYVVGKDMLVFAKLGLEMSKDQAVLGNSTTTVKSKNKRKTTFVPGFGVEKAFGNLIARVAYEYAPGTQIKDSSPSIGTASIKYKEHRVKVGVGYAF